MQYLHSWFYKLANFINVCQILSKQCWSLQFYDDLCPLHIIFYLLKYIWSFSGHQALKGYYSLKNSIFLQIFILSMVDQSKLKTILNFFLLNFLKQKFPRVLDDLFRDSMWFKAYIFWLSWLQPFLFFVLFIT